MEAYAPVLSLPQASSPISWPTYLAQCLP